MLAGRLGGTHQLPAILNRRGCGNLHCHMLPMLHGGGCYGNVPVPWRGDHDQVDILACQERVKIVISLGIELRGLLARLDDQRLCMLGLLLNEIAQRHHLRIAAEKLLQQRGAASAGSHQPNSRIYSGIRNIQHACCIVFRLYMSSRRSRG